MSTICLFEHRTRQNSHRPRGCCAADWRHMAGYVSSYPTLWSVSDMLSVRGRQAEKREAKKED